MTSSPAGLLFRHRILLWRVTRTELAARYAGSHLGLAWVFLYPLAVLTVYAVVYLAIFRVHVPSLTDVQYVLYMFSGLVPFLSCSEAISIGVSSVVANKQVLNNTIFPIELAPAKAVLGSQGTMLIGLGLILAVGAATGGLHWTVVFLPVLWVLQLAALVGVLWILSLINVVFRDLQVLVGIVLMVVMIASPIAYTPDMVPSGLKPFIAINPFAHFITAYQCVLVLGEVPSSGTFLTLSLGSAALFLLGNWFFAGSKRAVIDHV